VRARHHRRLFVLVSYLIRTNTTRTNPPRFQRSSLLSLFGADARGLAFEERIGNFDALLGKIEQVSRSAQAEVAPPALLLLVVLVGLADRVLVVEPTTWASSAASLAANSSSTGEKVRLYASRTELHQPRPIGVHPDYSEITEQESSVIPIP